METFQDVKLNLGGRLSQKLLLYDFFVIGIPKEMQEIVVLI